MMSDSKLLKDMCKVIEKALPSSKQDQIHFEIKGSFDQGRYFDEYLKKQQNKYKPKLKDRYKQTAESKPLSRRLNLQ